MKPEERFLAFLNGLVTLFTTDGGHIVLLAVGAAIALHVHYDAALLPIGQALYMKLKS